MDYILWAHVEVRLGEWLTSIRKTIWLPEAENAKGLSEKGKSFAKHMTVSYLFEIAPNLPAETQTTLPFLALAGFH